MDNSRQFSSLFYSFLPGEKLPVIGIDLGTTNSCVAVVKRGKVEIVENLDGKFVTPSCVAFTDEERLIGDQAKYNLIYDHKNTIYDVKRIIGRRFDDDKLQKDMRRWQFAVIPEEGKPKIKVKYLGETKTFSAQEISGMVLSRMKEIASGRLGIEVESAVITVPAYFTLSQRKATKDAARIAGLNVLAMINEPTAAAIAYGLQEEITARRNVLVYDLGGGTFDVTIMTIDNGRFVVKSSCGDSHLGGQDFNENLAKHLAAKFEEEYDEDLENGEPMERLRQECERVKVLLSTNTRAQVNLPGLQNSRTFRTKVSRAKFEELNEELFQRTLTAVQKAIRDAGMTRGEIDEVVTVGGSTRIPKIRKILEEYFEPKEILATVNPDEAVAYGAAAYAAFLAGRIDSGIVSIQDVTPLSLGIRCKGDIMSTVVRRNTAIPCKKSRGHYYTCADDVTRLEFEVFEGEREQCKENHLLGSFTLSGIRRRLAGEGEFIITFQIDKDRSALEVTALEDGTENSANVTICLNEGIMSNAEVEKLVEEAEEFRNEDKRWRERAVAMNDLESSAYAARRTLRRKLSCRRELKECEEIHKWAEDTEDATIDEIKEKKKELDDLLERCNVKI